MNEIFLIILIITSSIISSLYYKQQYVENFEQNIDIEPVKVAVACLMRKPIDLPLWLTHHRKLGINKFYIRLEDSPGWIEYLDTQSDIDYVISESDKSGNNYETLQTRQKEYVSECMSKAQKENIDWVFHIDSDELLDGNLEFLQKLDKKYKCLKLENVEAVFEEDKQDTCFDATKFLRCSDGAPCKSYGNGKAAGRVEDGVNIAGPHDFMYKGKMDGDHLYKVPFDTLHVLHYDSCSFGSWGEKFLNLSKNKKGDIPFEYYNESISAAKEAYDVYKKYKMIDTEGLDKSMMYFLE